MEIKVSEVKLELSDNSIVENEVIEAYITKAIELSEVITKYDTLPKKFKSIVISAVVEAIQRRGSEGEKQSSALGLSTTFVYGDMETSLRKKFKGCKNPYSLIGLHK